jgi:hypothetical protein
MTFPNAVKLFIQTLLLLSAFLTCEVQSFGARRDYHSYHHISKRTKRKMSAASALSASQDEKDEHKKILKKAAEIRKNLAELDGKVFCSFSPNRRKKND